jgi:serine/threonine protein kinase
MQVSPPDQDATASRRFEIHGCLGRGGFGEVYRATLHTGRGISTPVAVKVLHRDVDPGDSAVRRLRDEAHILNAVVHPTILKVHDLLVLDGRVALITELLDGEDLAACLKGPSRMGPRAVVEVIERVAAALHAAWVAPAPGGGQLQLVHRDIKPANIRIGRRGDVKLLDFGIARSDSVDREARTGTDYLVGSYLYMAPERFLDRSIRQPTDLYSLGCTLYECLAGERLFADCTLRDVYSLVLDPERHAAHLRDRFAALGPVPPRVLELLRDLLDYDAGKRPTASEVVDRCEALVERLDGPRLRAWCQDRSWPTISEQSGMLTGRILDPSPIGPSEDGPTVRDDTRYDTTTLDRTQPLDFPSGTVDREVHLPEPRPRTRFGLVARRPGCGRASPSFAVLVVASASGLVAVAAFGVGGSAERAPLPAPTPVAELDGGDVIQVGRSERSAPNALWLPGGPRTAPDPLPVGSSEPAPVAPAPVAAPALGQVIDAGKLPFTLRSGYQRTSPGSVPEGTWRIEVDFGSGVVDAGELTVRAGQVVRIRCKQLTQVCEVGP